MQIQRIQSLYILLAILAMAVFIIVPYGEVVSLADGVTSPLYTMFEYGVVIPSACVLVLLMADLFMYANPKQQRKVLWITMMLTLATAATVCFAVYMQAGAEGLDAHLSWWDLLLVAAVVLEGLAVKGITHDIKLLNSYNRLR